MAVRRSLLAQSQSLSSSHGLTDPSSNNPLLNSVVGSHRVSAEGRRKKMSLTYATDLDGRPVGLPLDLFLFSGSIKQLPPKQKESMHDFSAKNRLPETKQFAKAEIGMLAGKTPLTDDFHLASNRTRLGPYDDGLEDEDLTHADGIVRKKKLAVVKRKSIIYDNIWIYKGEFMFPYRTYRPKVQVPYKAGIGQVPQAVVVERLHRMYKRTDINLVLQQLGIEATDLIPPPNYAESNERFYQEMTFRNRIRINGTLKRDFILADGKPEPKQIDHSRVRLHAPKNQESTLSYPTSSSDDSTTSNDESEHSNIDEDPEEEKIQQQLRLHRHSQNQEDVHPFIRSKPPFGHMFPLYCFDNTNFDIRSPQDWISLGWDTKERKFFPLPGKAFLPLPGSMAKKQSQALSETVQDHLLDTSPRLMRLYQWLLKERFQRTVKSFGIDPDKLKFTPTEIEMSLLARMGSTVQALFRSSTNSFEGKEKHVLRNLEEQSLADVRSIEEIIGEMDSHESGSDPLNANMEMIDAGGNVIQLKNIVYKKRVERKLDSDSSDEDDETTTIKLKKKGSLSKKEDEATAISDTFAIEDEEEEETEIEEALEDDEWKEWTGTGPEPSKNVVHTDYGPARPASPDIDSLIEGHEKYVLDFDKMKKVHVHEWKWVDVAVFDYNETTNRFYVRTIYPPLIHAWVDKIYLCFDGEDPNMHGKRIRDAVIRRIEMENAMRFNLYVDCLPLDEFSTIDTKIMDIITSKTLSTPRIKFTDVSLARVKKEIELDYSRTLGMKKFIKIVDRHLHLYKPWVSVPDYERGPEKLDPQKEYHKLIERYQEIPQQSFEYKMKRIQKLSLKYNQKEPADALRRIHEICLEAKLKSLILMDVLPLHLDDWQRTQTENIQEVRQYLQYEWYQMIVDAIQEHLGKIPRSWFNLKEQNFDVFQMSKLNNYLQLIKTMMEDTLRSIVIESLERLIERIKELTMDIDYKRRFSWEGGDLISSLYPTPYGIPQLWVLEILMDTEQPKYSQLLGNFSRVAHKIFTETINAVKDFPTLLPQVMPQMQFAARATLNAPSESEPGFQKMLSELKKYIKRSLLPLDTYVQLYKRYLPIWNLDSFLKEWGKESHTADEVMAEVEHHMKDVEELEKEIPLVINITGFKVVTEIVRDGLIKKKKSIYTSILDQYAHKLKRVVQKVREDYAEIEKKLNTRSDDIEEVIELKAYVLTIPSLVEKLDEITLQVIRDYEVFDKFMIPISNDDVNAKWQMAVNSGKIIRMTKSATKWLEEDFDRLLHVQQGDLSALSDQIDSASLSVSGLIGFMDIEKAPEVSADVKKLWKTARELQEQSVLLNRRQKIFGYPPAFTNAIERLIADIEPYRNLWFIAADWLKVQESVFGATLEKVDIDVLSKVISEGADIIDELIEYFAGADQIQIMAQNLKVQLEEFQPLVPLISTLKNNGMRQRHWEAISDLTGISVLGRTQTFRKLQEQGITDFVKEITDIGEFATKEYNIELSLDRMLHGIATHKVHVDVDPETKHCTISLSEGAMATINEYIETTNAIKENEFKIPFEERIEAWDKRINAAKVTVDLLLQDQEAWLEIEPVFRPPEVQVRIPDVYESFDKLHRIWKRLIRLARNNSMLIELATDSTVVTSVHQFVDLVFKIRKEIDEHHDELSQLGEGGD